MSAAPKLIVGLGELLWDMLPEGKQLGGAPANFSVMAARLGNRAAIASRMGEDELAREAHARLAAFPVETGFIQKDAKHPTGSVGVTLKAGQAEYVIHEPVAWDFLELTTEWKKLASETDAVCFGSLAQREVVARRTIHSFLKTTRKDCVRVFDVNLRKPFFTRGVIEDSLGLATILKMNDGEIFEVMKLLKLDGQSESTDVDSLLHASRKILDEFTVRMVCITMGGSGSLLVTREGFDRHEGLSTEVVDTIGAGDAFTAAMTSYYLRGAPLAVLNEAGNRWGSWVASNAGAMPELSDERREAIEGTIATKWGR
jgi:fructokinase